jgi:hypothetical protein
MLSPVSTLSASIGRLGVVVVVGASFGFAVGVTKGVEAGIAMGVDGCVATVVEDRGTGDMPLEGEARLAGDDSLRPRFCEG